mmetsp:Transcript_27966/g.44875  ORF Transcript_27966/g.44875 Transcript_27966/m.44875 type:complete len:116 (+) Transcript_27966:448-795(+)
MFGTRLDPFFCGGWGLVLLPSFRCVTAPQVHKCDYCVPCVVVGGFNAYGVAFAEVVFIPVLVLYKAGNRHRVRSRYVPAFWHSLGRICEQQQQQPHQQQQQKQPMATTTQTRLVW